MSTEEKTIYEQAGIKITNLRAVFGEKTYAMSNITSVEKGSKAPSGCAPLIFFVAGGAAFLIALGNTPPSWGGVLLGVLLAGIGVMAYRSQKTEYVVQFGSSSGEIKAYTSFSEEEIKSIVQAINDAIIQKG